MVWMYCVQGPMKPDNHPWRLAAVYTLQVGDQPLPLLTMPPHAVLRREHHKMNEAILKRVPERRILLRMFRSALTMVTLNRRLAHFNT